jgi:hypothetical protein
VRRRWMRAPAMAAMLREGKRDGYTQPAPKNCFSEECRSTAHTRHTTAFTSCYAAYFAKPGHGSVSFSNKQNLVLVLNSPHALLAKSLIRRWIAGVVIQIRVQRIQLLIHLRIPIQQLQIVHGC